MKEVVSYNVRERVAIITINRPRQRNAINQEVEIELANAWRRFDGGDERVAILTGSGEESFCAGKDLKEDRISDYKKFTPGFEICVRKPIIAAVGGWCIGGGLTLVQMCDLCVASENAVFSYPEARLGFAGGLAASLVNRIPHKVAMELLLLGGTLSVERAYEVGLVNKIVPRGDHLNEAMKYARQLADNAPMVITMLKKFADETLPKGPIEMMSRNISILEAVMNSEDRNRGVMAARAKETPRFQGN